MSRSTRVVMALTVPVIAVIFAGGASSAGNHPDGRHCIELGSDALPGPDVKKCIPFDPGPTKDLIEKLIDELPPR